MLAMYFTHDGGETSKWRLKGHGKKAFWEWLATWAVVIRKPSDLGYRDAGYNLPPLRFHEHVVSTADAFGDQLFPRAATTLSEQRTVQRQSVNDRVSELAGLVNASKDTWIVWCHLNDESDKLSKSIKGSVEVKGADSPELKEERLDAFSDGKARVLVSKASIAGFGMNFQRCHKMAFVGMSHSFEQFYQAVRRCWRFGQQHPVDVHIFSAEGEGQIIQNLKRKERQHDEISKQMVDHMKDSMQREVFGAQREQAQYREDVISGEKYELRLGDCVKALATQPDESIDYSIFSPPFASLYTYSNSEFDMGNVKDEAEFMEQFKFLVDELLRITKPEGFSVFTA